ncbi:amino acid permease [Candidatus Cyanaurora vandensis]|uniref:amino acid permease n=1 Tax=Candidatus Cyanaurora vandensis TaxID=2714958 RepID=UPI00257B6BAA|nr:amino acid permease [Candidatus Cyanaurora vandensis]
MTLRRSMTFIDGAALIVGTTIGSGIFASPGKVLGSVGSVGLAMLVWVVAGLLSLAGALCYAELGAALPVSGGEYVYLRKGLDRSLGFMFTWTNFFVLKSGSQAIISIVFARYLGSVLLGLDPRTPNLDSDWRLKAIAITTLLVLTLINCLGVRWGALVQVIFTGLKLLALTGIIILGLGALVTTGGAGFNDPFTPFAVPPADFNLVSAFGLAMISALWAYDGWNNLNYVTEELQAPEKNLPRAIISGILGVMAVYILANLAYLAVLSPQQIVTSGAVATEFAVRVLGPVGGVLIPLAVAVSTFGSTNGSLLSGARVLYASARDGQFPGFLNRLSPQGVPVLALLVQGVWAAALVIPGNFGTLVDYFGFAAWAFYGLAAIALMRLRQVAPDLPRPYQVWPYPLIPLVFLGVSGFLVVNLLLESPLQSGLALGFMLLALPVYWLFFNRPTQAVPLNPP